MEMTLEAAREDLLRQVAEFLQERKEPDAAGGWPEVTVADRCELSSILSNLVTLKWACDADGDLPISWDLYDKTREDVVHGVRLPRDNFDRCIKRLSVHLVTTAERLDTYVDLREMEKKT